MATKIRNGRDEWAMRDEASHEYWSGTNTDAESRKLGALVPVTKLISQFYVQSPWDARETPYAIEFGKRVHSVAASCLRSRKPDLTPADAIEKAAFSATWQFARRIRDNNEVLGVEHPMFADGAGVAGTTDLVFKCNGRVYLCDWKTGDITKPAKCKFNAPFSHLVADPMTIYSLQCSMYQVLAEVGGYFGSPVFAPAKLLWLHTEGDAWKVDAITCRDLRREAATMMLSRSYTPWHKEWAASCPF